MHFSESVEVIFTRRNGRFAVFLFAWQQYTFVTIRTNRNIRNTQLDSTLPHPDSVQILIRYISTIIFAAEFRCEYKETKPPGPAVVAADSGRSSPRLIRSITSGDARRSIKQSAIITNRPIFYKRVRPTGDINLNFRTSYSVCRTLPADSLGLGEIWAHKDVAPEPDADDIFYFNVVYENR